MMDTRTERILQDIETNTEDGATVLALRILDALEVASHSLPTETRTAAKALDELVRKAVNLRPAMGAIGAQALLAWDNARTLASAGESRNWKDAVQTAVAVERARARRSETDIAAQATIVLGAPETIATCSYSSTVMNVLDRLSLRRMIVSEGHPLGDGARCAREAVARGYEVRLTSDDALPSALAGADAVIIGADQVLDDGAVVNRSGSFPLALGAGHFHVPVFVVCHRIKLAGISRSELRMEPCPGREEFGVPGASIHVPLFDVTPAPLIEKMITDVGVLTDEMTRELGRNIARLRRELDDIRR